MIVGRIIAPFLLAGILMGVAVAGTDEVRNYTPGEVESLAAYESAPVSQLVAIAKPPDKAPSEKFEVAQAVQKTVRDKTKSLGKAYGMEMAEKMSISGWGQRISASYRGPGKGYVFLEFNREGTQVTQALMHYVRLEDAATPALFEKRFADFHRRAFGFAPPAERPAEDRVRIERWISANSGRWRITVDGAHVGEGMILATPNQGDGSWIIQGTPCPSVLEVEEIADWLRKEPTKTTEEQAVAIAWKNWKAVRNVAAGKDPDLQITCQLRKGWKEELEPWGVFGVISRDARAWKNVAAVSDSPVPVFYEVKFTEDEAVSVLVDRLNGKVIRIHQGKTPW